MREAVLKNTSNGKVTIPLYEKVLVPAKPSYIPIQVELAPGETYRLGVDLDEARIDYYEQLKSVNVELELREPEAVPSFSTVEGITPAVLHDLRQHNLDKDLVEGYKVTAKQYEDKDYVKVEIEATGLRSHTNAQAVKGYWIGFAVTAPEGVTHMRTSFARGQNELDLLDDTLYELEQVADGVYGVAFYTNLSLAVPNLWARVEWYNGSEFVGHVDYYMDVTKVTLRPNILTKELASYEIAGTPYETLTDAIKAVKEGQTITVLKNDIFTDAIVIPAGKKFNLNLNGKILTCSAPGVHFFQNEGEVTIIDLVGGGVITRTDNGADDEIPGYVIYNKGNLIVNAGKICNNSGRNQPNPAGPKAGASLVCNEGHMTIAGGSFIQLHFIAIKNEGELVVTGGTITSEESSVQNWNKTSIKGGILEGTLWTDTWETLTGETLVSGGHIKGLIRMDYTSGEGISGLTILGGTFEAEWVNKNEEKTAVTIFDGTFKPAAPVEYLSVGLRFVEQEDGTFIVVEASEEEEEVE